MAYSNMKGLMSDVTSLPVAGHISIEPLLVTFKPEMQEQ